MLGIKRPYKLWWSGKRDGVGGVGAMVELCEQPLGLLKLYYVSSQE